MIYAAILLLLVLPVLIVFGLACHLFGRMVGTLWVRFIPPPAPTLTPNPSNA